MVSYSVALRHDPSQQIGVLLDLASQDEEGRLYVMLAQLVEDRRGSLPVGAVVEGQGDSSPPGPGLAAGGPSGRGIVGDRGIPDSFHVGLRYRSEEHTSELPSRPYLVCRLLLE